MTHRKIQTILGYAGILLFAAMACGSARADEKTGALVFNAMQKMQETHQNFLGSIKKIKADRKAAVADRNSVREHYHNAAPGSMDQKDFHARYSYAQGKVYNSLQKEAKLTHQVAKKHIEILHKLNDAVSNGTTSMSGGEAAAVVAATKPFLENARSLMASLSAHRSVIKDPVINARLNGAADTELMLANYLGQMEKGATNKNVSQVVLKRKVGELIEQLNAVYVQTDIFMALLRDKASLLKMVNQLAASETAILAISGGSSVVGQISEEIMGQMTDVLKESDDDLDVLMDGVVGGGETGAASAVSQRWAERRF